MNKRVFLTAGKYALMLLLFISVSWVYGHYFGELEGGITYQKRVALAAPRVALRSYYYRQMDHFKARYQYNPALHTSPRYSKIGPFKFGFAEEDPFIKQYCPDCQLTEKNFKMAAYGMYEDEMYLLVVDDKSDEVRLILGQY